MVIVKARQRKEFTGVVDPRNSARIINTIEVTNMRLNKTFGNQVGSREIGVPANCESKLAHNSAAAPRVNAAA
tara:strand:+ start:98 stop:316 length:219 start_codon:yes stop_codon:yes gene_type:complete